MTPSPARHHRGGTASRDLLTGVTCFLLTAALLILLPNPAQASPRIEVSPTTDLDPEGQTVTVRGSGFDTAKGIYVAFCVTPSPGQVPKPCGGGVDMDGTSGGSVWISDDPPPYGEGLARPFDDGGSFAVTIRVDPMIGEVDCREADCAVVTRADHLRTSDRSQDAVAPVSFRTAAPEPAPPSSEGSGDAEPATSEEPAGAPDTPSAGSTGSDEPPEEDERAPEDVVEEPDEDTSETGARERRRIGDREVAGDVGPRLRGDDDPPAPDLTPEVPEEPASGSSPESATSEDTGDEEPLAAASPAGPTGPWLLGLGVVVLIAVGAAVTWWRRRTTTGRPDSAPRGSGPATQGGRA